MKIYKAINEIQKELNVHGITKDRKNAQQGYSFRGIDDVYNALSPLLAKHGVCILPRVLARTVAERETKAGGTLFSVCVEAEFDFVCSEDGSKHVVKTFGEAMDSADKATNKALSAAYKYACIQAFAIPTEGDNDADNTTHDGIKTVVREPAKPERTSAEIVKDIKSRPYPKAEAGDSEIAVFIPTDVDFVNGTGKGAGKMFSKIKAPDGKVYDSTEVGGEIAVKAKDAHREISVSFVQNGRYLNAKLVKYHEAPKERTEPNEVAPEIEGIPF